jgi:hypothetical protein
LALFQLRPNQWIPLPEIMALAIAQYNSRVHELRKSGHQIENRKERKNGKVHSWFRYVSAPKFERLQPWPEKTQPAPSLFGDGVLPNAKVRAGGQELGEVSAL